MVFRVEDVFLSAFRFDESNVRSIPPGRRSPMDDWFLSDTTRWRVEQEAVKLDVPAQYFATLKGEEGSGKTTELRIYADALQEDPEKLPLEIDFTDCPEGADFEHNLAKFVRMSLERQLQRRGLFMEFRSELIRLQLAQTFHGFYAIQYEYRGNLETISPDVLLNSERIQTACAIYESQREGEAHALAISAAQQLSVRPYFLLDNADLLGKARIQVIARMFSKRLNGNTYVIATSRPENHVAWIRGANERRQVHTIDLRSSSDRLFAIAKKRLAGAQQLIVERFPSHSAQSEELSSRLLISLDAIRRDQPATRLVSDWHNRSVREMLPSIVVVATNYAQRRPGESLHGIAFRNLVSHAMPESLLDIYTPDYPDTPGHGIFVFLKLRILAYLYRRRDDDVIPTLSRLVNDFQVSFGVSPIECRKAVHDMEQQRDQVAGALVRVQESEVDSIEPAVQLLSAGRCFMEDVVVSCDFLSWVYERNPSVRQVSDEGAISQVKLNKAVELVRSHILDMFMKEHPYMQEGLSHFRDRRPPKDVRRRIRSYRTMFGYYPGHWFIAGLGDTLEKYANRRKDVIKDRSEVESLILDIKEYVRNLDEVAAFND